MWTPDKAKLVKVLLHSRGEDVETPWAEDLGLDPTRPGRRLVRLGNVPFLHAKPTYEDVISVEYDDELGHLAWNRQDVPFSEIGTQIDEDAGRWAMIIDYQLRRDSSDDLQAAFRRLDLAGESADIMVEGAFVRKDKRGGRAYLAVPARFDVSTVLRMLDNAQLPLELTLVHPRDDD